MERIEGRLVLEVPGLFVSGEASSVHGWRPTCTEPQVEGYGGT